MAASTSNFVVLFMHLLEFVGQYKIILQSTNHPILLILIVGVGAHYFLQMNYNHWEILQFMNNNLTLHSLSFSH